MKPKPNIILIVICTLVVAAGAYWYFFTGTGNEPSLSPVGPSSSISQARFQALVSELSSVTFDTRIFADPRFMGLVDLTTPIEPETIGRIDPFAPLGVGALPRSATTSTQSAPRTPAAP